MKTPDTDHLSAEERAWVESRLPRAMEATWLVFIRGIIKAALTPWGTYTAAKLYADSKPRDSESSYDSVDYGDIIIAVVLSFLVSTFTATVWITSMAKLLFGGGAWEFLFLITWVFTSTYAGARPLLRWRVLKHLEAQAIEAREASDYITHERKP